MSRLKHTYHLFNGDWLPKKQRLTFSWHTGVMLEDYPRDFNIQNKVVLTTVDNSSNLIKSFSVLIAEEDVTED